MGKKDRGEHGSRQGMMKRVLCRAVEGFRNGNAWKRQEPVCAPENSRRLHDGPAVHACPCGCSLPPEGCQYMTLPEAYENRCALCMRCTNRCLENPASGAPGIVKKNPCGCHMESGVENPWG